MVNKRTKPKEKDADTGDLLAVQVSFRETEAIAAKAKDYAKHSEQIKFTDFARKLFRIALDLYEPGGGLRALRDLRDRLLAERQSHTNQETYRAHGKEPSKSDRTKAAAAGINPSS